MGKKCSKCLQVLCTTEFHKTNQSKDGFKTECKKCRSSYAKAVRVNNGGTNRIDRSIETNTTKICTKCLILKSKEEFKNPAWCQDCIKIYNRHQADLKGVIPKFIPIISEDSKQCCDCKIIKPLTDFSRSTRGAKFKSSYCKPCASKRQLKRKTKEERREITQKYRDTNREWWRFLHRVNQFNRRKNIKINSDGSVTKEFMISIYNTKFCYYCKKETTIQERTCEHKQPISKGGLHGTSNLVMSCLSCNTSKRNKTELEFLNYLKTNANKM